MLKETKGRNEGIIFQKENKSTWIEPEVKMYLVESTNSKEAIVSETEWVEGRTARDKITDIWKQII